MPEQRIFDELRSEISKIVNNSPENELAPGKRYFDEPLLAIAAGDHQLFEQYKSVVGPFHWLPSEAMAQAGFNHDNRQLSVVCWVLPIAREIRESNRQEKIFPSRQWALTRNFGEAFNTTLRNHVVAWFMARGIKAAAPLLVDGWHQVNEGPHGIASTWSERHAAFAAGLGTFSLNDGFITERGMAHRLGSVVAAINLSPASIIEKGVYDNCLYHRVGRCGVCISRCPAKALSRDGHDKNLCMKYVYGTIPKQVAELYGVTQTGCGLCQTAVPCEAINPCRE
jgi:epoxyqueuosine reductase QueG